MLGREDGYIPGCISSSFCIYFPCNNGFLYATVIYVVKIHDMFAFRIDLLLNTDSQTTRKFRCAVMISRSALYVPIGVAHQVSLCAEHQEGEYDTSYQR